MVFTIINILVFVGLSVGCWFFMMNPAFSGWFDGGYLPEHREFDRLWEERRKEMEDRGMTTDEIMVEFLIAAPGRRPLWKRILGTDLVSDPRKGKTEDVWRREMLDELEAKEIRRKHWRENQGSSDSSVPVKVPFTRPSRGSEVFWKVYEKLEEKGPSVTKDEALGFIYLLERELRASAWKEFVRMGVPSLLGAVAPILFPPHTLLAALTGAQPDPSMFKAFKVVTYLMGGLGCVGFAFALVGLWGDLRGAARSTEVLESAIGRGEQLFT